ncbi:hypothetical protein ABZ892_29270 [Streptomyces sp. NPDC046924]|uniref:hypothetical protein n=1 Tax=Streptomyces sp. NPDC046924 TaxID=3155136 RepID=UPI0033C31A4A
MTSPWWTQPSVWPPLRKAPVLLVAVLPAQRQGPARAGADAHSLIEASSLHGGPFVYAVAPAHWTVPVAGSGPGSAELSPTGVRNVWAPAQRRLPHRPAGAGGVTDGPTAWAPWWLPTLVDPVVGGVCRPHDASAPPYHRSRATRMTGEVSTCVNRRPGPGSPP